MSVHGEHLRRPSKLVGFMTIEQNNLGSLRVQCDERPFKRERAAVSLLSDIALTGILSLACCQTCLAPGNPFRSRTAPWVIQQGGLKECGFMNSDTMGTAASATKEYQRGGICPLGLGIVEKHIVAREVDGCEDSRLTVVVIALTRCKCPKGVCWSSSSPSICNKKT